MANGHGGRRPGAGRKTQKAQDYQTDMRAIFHQVVTPERWQRIVSVAASYAEAGDKDARKWLAPWVVGAEPHETVVKGDVDQPLEIVVRYTGADEND